MIVVFCLVLLGVLHLSGGFTLVCGCCVSGLIILGLGLGGFVCWCLLFVALLDIVLLIWCCVFSDFWFWILGLMFKIGWFALVWGCCALIRSLLRCAYGGGLVVLGWLGFVIIGWWGCLFRGCLVSFDLCGLAHT